VFAVAMLVGPFTGGILTDTVGWHWIFFVNIPVGIVTLVVIGRLMPKVSHPERVISIDYLGAAAFTAAIVPIMLGLTNKLGNDWTDPSVAGLMLLGAVLLGVFVWIESRAKDPILHLGLFANRTFTASVLATGLVSFGFFGGIIFIPRWFQFVLGSSATESGYQILPMMAGLMIGSIGSGQIVSRTGRYKWLLVGGLSVASIGLLLLTQIRAETSVTTMWIWLAIMGLGIGPTMAVFTIVVQNAVPFREMGVARADVLPPDWWLDRAGARRHRVRQLAGSRHSYAAFEGGRSAADRGSIRVEPGSHRGRRDQRRRRPRQADPVAGTGAVPAARPAGDPTHRRGPP
jgi:MFS family permease